MLNRLHYADKDEQLLLPDPQIVLTYDVAYLENGVLAPESGKQADLAADSLLIRQAARPLQQTAVCTEMNLYFK
jgi:hypothetical protein